MYSCTRVFMYSHTNELMCSCGGWVLYNINYTFNITFSGLTSSMLNERLELLLMSSVSGLCPTSPNKVSTCREETIITTPAMMMVAISRVAFATKNLTVISHLSNTELVPARISAFQTLPKTLNPLLGPTTPVEEENFTGQF